MGLFQPNLSALADLPWCLYTWKGQKVTRPVGTILGPHTDRAPACVQSPHRPACRLLQASQASFQPRHKEICPVKKHVVFAAMNRIGK